MPTWSWAGAPLGPGSPGPWAPRFPRRDEASQRLRHCSAPESPGLLLPAPERAGVTPDAAPRPPAAGAPWLVVVISVSLRPVAACPPSLPVRRCRTWRLADCFSLPLPPSSQARLATPRPGLASPPHSPQPGRRMQAAGGGARPPPCHALCSQPAAALPTGSERGALGGDRGPFRAAAPAGGPASLSLLLRLPALFTSRLEPSQI